MYLFDLQENYKECKGVFVLVSDNTCMIHEVTQTPNRAAAIVKLVQLHLLTSLIGTGFSLMHAIMGILVRSIKSDLR